jgi:DNA mismatch repair protein MutH
MAAEASQREQETLNAECEEPPLLRAIARQRLMKQDWEDLLRAIVNGKVYELEPSDIILCSYAF